MTHVLCLCPCQHRQAVLQFSESVDHEHALKTMRVVVGASLEAKELLPYCPKCEAPSESWYCEVAMPVADSENTLTGGVSSEA